MKCYLKDHGVSDTLNNLHWCARHTKQSTHFYICVSDILHIFSVIAHHRLMTNKCAVHTSLFTVHGNTLAVKGTINITLIVIY